MSGSRTPSRVRRTDCQVKLLASMGVRMLTAVLSLPSRNTPVASSTHVAPSLIRDVVAEAAVCVVVHRNDPSPLRIPADDLAAAKRCLAVLDEREAALHEVPSAHPFELDPARIVFAAGRPVADQPLDVLQAILAGRGRVGGVAAIHHDPLSLAPCVDDGVARRGGLAGGKRQPGDALFDGDVRAEKADRLDVYAHRRAGMRLEHFRVEFLDCGAAAIRLPRLVRVLGVRRPKGPHGLGVGGVECLDEVVGRRPNRLFVGGALGACGGGVRRGRWIRGCGRRGKPHGRRRRRRRREQPARRNPQSKTFPLPNHKQSSRQSSVSLVNGRRVRGGLRLLGATWRGAGGKSLRQNASRRLLRGLRLGLLFRRQLTFDRRLRDIALTLAVGRPVFRFDRDGVRVDQRNHAG